MMYIDSTIFINAVLDTSRLGEKAREVLQNVSEGKVKAATSAITFDEVFWIVKKNTDYDRALIAGKDILDIPNLKIIETNEIVLRKTYELMEKYRTDPRDSIHAASALISNINVILSEDSDFDKIKELSRKRL